MLEEILTWIFFYVASALHQNECLKSDTRKYIHPLFYSSRAGAYLMQLKLVSALLGHNNFDDAPIEYIYILVFFFIHFIYQLTFYLQIVTYNEDYYGKLSYWCSGGLVVISFLVLFVETSINSLIILIYGFLALGWLFQLRPLVKNIPLLSVQEGPLSFYYHGYQMMSIVFWSGVLLITNHQSILLRHWPHISLATFQIIELVGLTVLLSTRIVTAYQRRNSSLNQYLDL